MTAFVLGAGLGTRLRPLTDHCPKPLLQLRPGRALVENALDHLIDQAGVTRFFVNTHWQPQCWPQHFPGGAYRRVPLQFLHEPTLLDTGGGLANLFPHWRAQVQQHGEDPAAPLWLYNGDILCDAPLAPLAAAHAAQKSLCTLLLRPAPGNVRFDPASSSVVDLRGSREAAGVAGLEDLPQLQYGGIALIDPDFARFLRPAGEVFSLVESWLKLINSGEKLAAAVIDEGRWADLGTREEWDAAVVEAAFELIDP